MIWLKEPREIWKEYTRRLRYATLKDHLPPTNVWLANPALSEDITVRPMPGYVCCLDQFLFHLDLLVQYLESKIGTKIKETQTPLDFLKSFYFFKFPFNTNFLRFLC